MAAVTDPRAVAFANQKIRVQADLLNTMYQTAKVMVAQWNAQQMGNLIPFTSDIIEDGASVNGVDATGGDGRPLLTCSAAEQIFNLSVNIINFFERGTLDTSGTQNNANLNNVLAVQVNGQSRF